MNLNASLIRSTFSAAAENEPRLVQNFYNLLFTRYPQVKPMFSRNAPDKQAQMLQEALVAVVDHLDDATWLADTLRAMRRKHLDYGVEPQMYDWVGECLLAALADAAGDSWSDEAAQAWTEAYQALAGLMLNGAQD